MERQHHLCERNGAVFGVHAVVCSKRVDTSDIVREAMCYANNGEYGMNRRTIRIVDGLS
jgi:hypothetical protein